MKEYLKPEMSIKTLVQNTDIAAVTFDNSVYEEEAHASAHDWWPDFAE